MYAVWFRVNARWVAKRLEGALYVLVRHHRGENVLSLGLAERLVRMASVRIEELQREKEEWMA